MKLVSKLGGLKTAVTSKTGRTLLKGKKASPNMLFIVGVGGVVTSTVLACRATLKVDEINQQANHKKALATELYDEDRKDYTEHDLRRDLALIQVRRGGEIIKLYAPAITVGLLSVGMLVKSHDLLSKRNAGLIAAYTVLDKGFNEYRERVLEAVGPEKEREFRMGSETREIVIETKNGVKIETVKSFDPERVGHSMYAQLFDRHNQNWSPQPEYNMIFLRAQQQYANDRLQARGHLLLNDVYDCLGLDRTKAGCVVGWVLGETGDNYVDFGIFNGQQPNEFYDFVTGREGAIWLDFNVDGVVYDKI